MCLVFALCFVVILWGVFPKTAGLKSWFEIIFQYITFNLETIQKRELTFATTDGKAKSVLYESSRRGTGRQLKNEARPPLLNNRDTSIRTTGVYLFGNSVAMESGRVKIAKYNHEFADDKHQCPVTDMVSMAKSIGNERGHKFNDLQACAWASCVLQKKSVFLSGGAGVGKSFTMKSIASYVAEKHKPGSVLVCAPTGTAALVASSACLKGCTLHRAFGIQRRNKSELGNQDKLVIKLDLGPPYDTNLVAEEDADVYEDERNTEMISFLSERQMNTLEEVKLLVIDECSMVSKEMILLVDYVLRRVNYKAGMPFGGVQVLAVGDFLQVSTHAVFSRSWRNCKPGVHQCLEVPLPVCSRSWNR